MAVELVREVWCDIDLKKNKTKVIGDEAVATVLHEGRFIKIDTCVGCFEKLTFAEILTYGESMEPPHASRARMSEKIRNKKDPRGGPRKLVECSVCHKQVTSGSGWGLHNGAHIKRGVTNAEPIPVVA